MTRLQWILLGLCILGLANPAFWLLAIVIYEAVSKRGRTIVAAWLASKID
jgi:hypothetical protein